MICVSIKEDNYSKISAKIQDEEFVEIRLDDAILNDYEMSKIFSQKSSKTIATCRAGKYNKIKRKQILLQAITLGADYVDVEIESDENYNKEIINHAVKNSCKVIISYHNFKETPSLFELKKIIEHCFKDKADIAKIACKINSKRDLAKILALYDFNGKDNKILALGMGKMGKISRILAPVLGAPFIFVSKGKETAEGQLSKEKFLKIFNSINDL